MNDLVVCQLDNYQHVFVIIGVAITEYWLGRTSRTKSGSLIELILNTFSSLMNRITKRSTNGNETSNSDGSKRDP